jgi:hypothetical protein
MRTSRAFLAGLATSMSLLAAAASMFLMTSALLGQGDRPRTSVPPQSVPVLVTGGALGGLVADTGRGPRARALGAPEPGRRATAGRRGPAAAARPPGAERPARRTGPGTRTATPAVARSPRRAAPTPAASRPASTRRAAEAPAARRAPPRARQPLAPVRAVPVAQPVRRPTGGADYGTGADDGARRAAPRAPEVNGGARPFVRASDDDDDDDDD